MGPNAAGRSGLHREYPHRGKVAEEVVQHLAVLPGAEVEVTLEIHAKIPEGAPERVVRTVTENCSTLRFENHQFEER